MEESPRIFVLLTKFRTLVFSNSTDEAEAMPAELDQGDRSANQPEEIQIMKDVYCKRGGPLRVSVH